MRRCIIALAISVVAMAGPADCPWSFEKKTDTMTDKVSYIGHYKDNKYIQASPNFLAIIMRGRGGVRSVQVRLGDNPALPLRLATDREQDVGAVIIDGAEFSDALRFKRIRVRVLSILGPVVTEDISMDGFQEELKKVMAAN